MTILNRNIAPEIKAITSIRMMEPQKYNLNNGVPVFVFNDSQQELLKIDLVFNAGSSVSKNPLIATTVSSMLTEVSKNYNSAELAEAIDFYGAYFDTQTTKDFTTVSLYTLKKYLQNTIEILEEIIKNPSFEKKDLTQFVAKKKQEFMVNSGKVDFIARQQFQSLLFGENHPYGKYIQESDFDNLKQEELIKFHKENYLQGELRIYVAGNFGKTEVEMLNNRFGNMNQLGENKNNKIEWVKTPTNKLYHKINKDNSIQNAIRIGFVSPHINDEDYFGLKILTTILGGYFGSRLMTNIREDKGYTYGIGSGISSFKNESIFLISTEINSDVSELSIKEIKNELLRLQTEIIPENELTTVKNYMLGNIQRNFDGIFSQLERYSEIDLKNTDCLYYSKYINTIKTIDSKILNHLANKYFVFNKMNVLNVGK